MMLQYNAAFFNAVSGSLISHALLPFTPEVGDIIYIEEEGIGDTEYIVTKKKFLIRRDSHGVSEFISLEIMVSEIDTDE